jgi:hypothetical protein
MKRFVLRSTEVVQAARNFLASLPLEPIQELIVRDAKKDRTAAQNSLYWHWLTIIASELGSTKEDQHTYYKKHILVHIYERDDADYAEMIESVRRVHRQGNIKDAKHLADMIVRLTSTTDASVKQFTEYLNELEKDAFEKGITLPHPEDRYYEAMGIKEPNTGQP